MECWDKWAEAALSVLSSKNLTRSTRPISLPPPSSSSPLVQTYDGPHIWDRSTLRSWLNDLPNPTGIVDEDDDAVDGKLVLFSGNDYLGLSGHPAVREAAAKGPLEHGMGPRGSALICGYTDYHGRLEAEVADLKKEEVLTPNPSFDTCT